MKKIKFDSRQVRQALSLLVALLLVGSVSYLGEQFYRASHAATGASMSINPSSGTFTPGSTVSLTVRENSGSDPVNSVQAAVTYDMTQLQYTGMTEGDFPSVAHNTPSTPADANGEIIASRYTTSGDLTGDKAIVTLNFKVLANSGTVAVSIDRANSGVNRSSDDTDILQGLVNGSFTVGASSANTATFSLDPAGGSYAPGSTFNVDVHVNSPTDRIVVAEPFISYPASKVTFVKAVNSAAFPTVALDSNKNGVLDLMRGINSGSAGLTGDNIVVTLQFKVTASSGNIPLAFTSASNAMDDSRSGKSVLNLAGSKGTTYAISNSPTQQPPTPTPTPTPTNPGSGGGGGGSTGGGGSNGGGSSQPVTVVTQSGGLSVSSNGSNGSVSQSGDATQLEGVVDLAPTFDQTQTDTQGHSIVQVEYLLGKKSVAVVKTPPFTYSFDTKKLKNGTYTVTTKTTYDNGTVDSSTDTLIVHNPVTLSYLFQHYAAVMVVVLLLVLGAIFAFFKLILPRLRGDGGYPTNGYEGYDGYMSPTPMGPSPIASDPTVIAPGGGVADTGPIAGNMVTPEAPAAPQSTVAPTQTSDPGYVSPPTPPAITRSFTPPSSTPPAPSAS